MLGSFYCEPAAQLSQGDLLEFAPHVYINVRGNQNHGLTVETMIALPKDEEVPVSVACQSVRSLVVTPDCEISHPERAQNRVVVCPVRPLSTLSREKQGDAKRHRIAHLFFLPRHGAKLEDSIAFLNQLTTVDIDLIRSVPKIATLHVAGRRALDAQFLRWLSRWVLAELSCPQCEMVFDPSMLLPTRAPDDP